jgi:uracil-DNA glycosylase
MCTYHPSYLLRLTGADEKRAKNECWDDMKQVLRRMGRPVPGR